MAENSITYNFDEILTTTLMNWRDKGKFHDNVFKSNPAFWWIYEKAKATQQGGERIIVNIQHGKNDTVGSYSRYDVLTVKPQDNQTAAYYAWKQFSGCVVIDGYSEAINQGKSKIVSLLQTKIDELEDSMAEDLNTQLWRTTPASSKDILSIPSLVVPYPTTYDAQTPGGISGVTNSYWRNQKVESSATTWKGVAVHAKHLFNLCSNGGNKNGKGHPDFGMCDQATFEHLQNYQEEKERYIDGSLGKKAYEIGFDNFKLKKATMFYDEMVGDAYGDGSTIGYDYGSATYGTLYLLNSNTIEYVVMTGRDLAPQPFIKPANQDCRISHTFHMHNLCIKARRKNGVLTKITKTLAA